MEGFGCATVNDRRLPVNLSSMAQLDYEHDESVVFDSADRAIVANAVTPEFTLVAFKGLADPPRIIIARDTLAKEFDNPHLHRAIEFS